LTIDARDHYYFFNDYLSRGFNFGSFEGFVDSFEVDDYEDYWQAENEKKGYKNNPKCVHILPGLVASPIYSMTKCKPVIGFMKCKLVLESNNQFAAEKCGLVFK